MIEDGANMSVEELKRELRSVIKKYENKQVGVGEVRIDWMAEDCLRCIEDLQAELEAAKEP